MKRVLLVDDEKMVADIIGKFLVQKGFDVNIAYDIETGMEKSEAKYDVCLLDIRLGDVDCFPLLEKIKKDDPESLVFMLSGFEDEEHIQKAKRMGADGFIHKPFKFDFLEKTLLDTINKSLFKKQKKQKNS